MAFEKIPKMAIYNHLIREISVIIIAIYAYISAENTSQVALFSAIFMTYACLSNVCYNIWLSNVMTSVNRDRQVAYFAGQFEKTQDVANKINSEFKNAENVQEYVHKKFDIVCHSNFFLICIVIFNLIKSIVT